LAQIAQRHLLLLGVLVELLVPVVEHLVGRLIGGGDAQRVGDGYDADNRRRGGRSLGDGRNFRRRRQLHLNLLLRRGAWFIDRGDRFGHRFGRRGRLGGSGTA